MPGVALVRCFGHTLNLILKKVINFKGKKNNTTLSDEISEDEDDETNDYSELGFDGNQLAAIEKVKSLTKKCRQIAGKFSHSTVLSDLLIEKQSTCAKKLKLIQEVSTRWNTTYLMLDRILVLRTHLNNVLSESHN